MSHITILDNHGITIDQYTVIIDRREVYGMSKDPKHVQGFNQFSHELQNWDEYDLLVRRLMNDGQTLVGLSSPVLPEEVRQAIFDRCYPQT
jgi:hypothetical protein